jgi:hypothetical protein
LLPIPVLLEKDSVSIYKPSYLSARFARDAKDEVAMETRDARPVSPVVLGLKTTVTSSAILVVGV